LLVVLLNGLLQLLVLLVGQVQLLPDLGIAKRINTLELHPELVEPLLLRWIGEDFLSRLVEVLGEGALQVLHFLSTLLRRQAVAKLPKVRRKVGERLAPGFV